MNRYTQKELFINYHCNAKCDWVQFRKFEAIYLAYKGLLLVSVDIG